MSRRNYRTWRDTDGDDDDEGPTRGCARSLLRKRSFLVRGVEKERHWWTINFKSNWIVRGRAAAVKNCVAMKGERERERERKDEFVTNEKTKRRVREKER